MDTSNCPAVSQVVHSVHRAPKAKKQVVRQLCPCQHHCWCLVYITLQCKGVVMLGLPLESSVVESVLPHKMAGTPERDERGMMRTD